ncbi:MAG: lipoate--protein ligase [Salibacteraceae bacterium]
MVKLFRQEFDTPQENLAFEEWYFNNFEEPSLRLWINPPSVVVGKHQCAFGEVNLNYCRQLGLPVIRRISGGGTVVHDYGNVNFSFFGFTDPENVVDYHNNLTRMANALKSLGYPVEISPRNDLFIAGAKISGNAQHISKGKFIHHGTLLYNSNLERLSACIRPSNEVITHKGVKSVRSKVTNLIGHCNVGSTSQFVELLMTALCEASEAEHWILTPEKLQAFDKARSEKYTSSEWNLFYGPPFTINTRAGGFAFCIEVGRGGHIQHVGVKHINGADKDIDASRYTGQRLSQEVLLQIAREMDAGDLEAEALCAAVYAG